MRTSPCLGAVAHATTARCGPSCVGPPQGCRRQPVLLRVKAWTQRPAEPTRRISPWLASRAHDDSCGATDALACAYWMRSLARRASEPPKRARAEDPWLPERFTIGGWEP